jgi:hypothetical protein
VTWESQPIPGGWEFKNGTASIILDYIYPIGRGLEAWVELRVNGSEIPVAAGRRDLTTADAAAPFLRQLSDSETNWAEGLRSAFYFAIQADRDGAATLDLATVTPEGLLFLVDPIIESGGNTRLIAPGGSGKSLLALAVVLTVVTGSHRFLGLGAGVTGPVLYLDWETNAGTHAQRLRALCDPLSLPVPDRNLIFYRNERGPLARSIQAVSRAVRTSGAVMLVVDSAKMAAGPSGQSSGEESTLSMYTALRELGLPALIIDHKNREDMAKGRRGGYGSIYMENLARLQWEFTSLQDQPGRKRFVLELTKENNVGRKPSLGFELVTAGDQSGITTATFSQVSPDLVRAGDDSGLSDRIASLFLTSPEPLDVVRIAELLGESGDTVRARLNRDSRFLNVNEGRRGRRGVWRLKEEYLAGPTDDGIQDSFEPPSDDVDVY